MMSVTRAVCALILTLIWIAGSLAASDLIAAKVIAKKKYEHGRIAYWEGYVPVFDNYPVYDITIEVDKKTYRVRYESHTGYYPRRWDVGNQIRVRRERGRFLLKNGEEEIPALIVSKEDCVVPVRANRGLPCD